MGNRAVIALKAMPSVGIYVHWNGGRESIEAFLEATKQRKARSPKGDPTYAFARLTQTVADFFNRGRDGELLSVGAGPLSMLDTDNGDNGTFWIGDDWSIVGRDGSGHGRGTYLTKGDREKRDGITKQLMAIDTAREAVSETESA